MSSQGIRFLGKWGYLSYLYFLSTPGNIEVQSKPCCSVMKLRREESKALLTLTACRVSCLFQFAKRPLLYPWEAVQPSLGGLEHTPPCSFFLFSGFLSDPLWDCPHWRAELKTNPRTSLTQRPHGCLGSCWTPKVRWAGKDVSVLCVPRGNCSDSPLFVCPPLKFHHRLGVAGNLSDAPGEVRTCVFLPLASFLS